MPRTTADTTEGELAELEGRIELLRCLADSTRLRLLALLGGGGEVCVCYLHDALRLPQPTVSRHLAVLRKRGLVSTRRDGLWVHYRLAEAEDGASGIVRLALSGTERIEPFRSDRACLDRLRPPSACCGGGPEVISRSARSKPRGGS